MLPDKKITSPPPRQFTDELQQSRAWDVLKGNALAIFSAMGSVFAARHLAPSTMHAAQENAAKLVTRYGNANCKGEALHDAARKSVNTALMLTSGLVTGIGSQTLFARHRRDAFDVANEVSVGRDITRLLTGWSFGSVGASAAYYMAERYGHVQVQQAEKLLDYGLKGVEYAKGNRVSEGLIANAIMTAGAIPVNVVGQRLYDALLCHPLYETQRQ